MRWTCVFGALYLLGCGQEMEPSSAVSTRKEELRPTDTSSSLMWRYEATDVVESIAVDGGSFRVHFTRTGLNAVPSLDANDSGVPDFAEQAEDTYEAVGALYHGALGLRHPLSDEALSPNGGDGRFDVYLLNFAAGADGAYRPDQCSSSTEHCIGYVVQENDFATAHYPSPLVGTRILGSHEYSHAVQAAYDSEQDSVVSEGTAVWLTERFDPSTYDFEGFIDGYLSRMDRSLDSPPPGPVPSFAYGSAIFFKFLSERHGDAIIRQLWEKLENGQGDVSEPSDKANPSWLIQLDALLKREYHSDFAQEFAEFARWNLYMNSAADASKAWLDASEYASVSTTQVTAPYSLAASRVFYASAQYFSVAAQGRTAMTAALIDSPLTAQDDRQDVVVWLAARKGGRNTEVVRLTQNETVDVTNGTLIVSVVNPRRGPVDGALSQRPGICIGSPDEVASCVAAANTTDAGVDGGPHTEADAGMTVDAGSPTMPPQPVQPCGCASAPGSIVALGLFALGLTRRRR